ncbi:MAG: ABC transporter ATP-binding protein [Acidiferrobacterales bacterium]|nr:ABC transporter ATP-binding protein [Acidiferrobacterales bacterium]
MTKSFPGVLANEKVNLTVQQGEVHALLGENGAGKSTLVKMIYGILRADSGEIRWQGNVVDIHSPAFARSLGIAMVFQHFSLFDSLTVFENIVLGMDVRDTSNLRDEIGEISTRYGLPLDPDRHVYTLSVGERQRIEIIRCLLQHPKLLVMDEPTSVLTPQEVEKLFETLQRLSSEGMSILYISHKLDEIKALCQRATILRGGKVVDCVDIESETASSLATKMMGEELAASSPKQPNTHGELRLEVNDLNLDAEDEFGIPLRHIQLQAKAGEILGIAGVAGNGQDELLSAISGESVSGDNASVVINGLESGKLGPNQRRMLGLASIPEERLGHGAVPGMTLESNGFLTAFRRLGLLSHGFIQSRASRDFAKTVIDRFDVKANGEQATASSLSGGNLQKFIVGREISQNPELLVVSQPTWGVDAGAAQTIHEALRDLATNGTAVVVISQDTDELMKISDRLGAICGGVVSPFYPTSSLGIEQVGLLMAGASIDASVSGDAHVV